LPLSWRRLPRHVQPRIPVWRIDETYMRVAGKWTYLYRAVDGRGATVEFYLSTTRDVKAGKLFLRKAISGQHLIPLVIVADSNPTYPIAVRALQREGKLPRVSATAVLPFGKQFDRARPSRHTA
jgi:IS6 family transposase